MLFTMAREASARQSLRLCNVEACAFWVSILTKAITIIGI